MLFTFGCSGIVDDESDQSVQKIRNGQEADQAFYKSIVAIVHNSKYCTGSLIQNNLVLTAGHCLRDDLEMYIFYGFSDIADSNWGNAVKVIDSARHSEYDLGLLLLAEPIGDHCVKIVNSSMYDTYLNPGQVVEIVGYGSTTVGEYNSKLHAADTIISERNKNFLYTGGDGNSDVCFGDSGGPVYIYPDNEQQIAAVISAVSDGACKGSIHVLPYPHIDWISESYVNMLDAHDIAYHGELADGDGSCNLSEHKKSTTHGGCAILPGRPSKISGALVLSLLLLLFVRKSSKKK